MTVESGGAVDDHYTRGDLGVNLLDALSVAGKDLDALKPDDLSSVDQFHTGGRAATLELARLTGIGPGQTVLDIEDGLGGPGTRASNSSAVLVIARGDVAALAARERIQPLA